MTISSNSITNTFTYDGFARQVTATDGRGNTSTTAYNDLGQVAYVEDAASNRTSFVYNSLGQRTSVSNALGQVSQTAYDPQGHVIAEWGTSYPVAYQFDTAGRMIALATTRNNEYASVNLNTLVPIGETLSSLSTQNSALDITRWCYDGTTGLLTSKLYADGNGTAYTYTDSGRLATRTWARGPVTTYSYDSLGQLTEIDYSQWLTPDVTYTHDRLGRVFIRSQQCYHQYL
jgi:YD repeat-containing protein